MKTINISTGSFDQDNTFSIEPLKYSKCKLYQGYKTEDDGIYWVMQCSAMLKAHYTDKDKEESARLSNPDNAIKNGEIVLIDGKQYKFRFTGDFSDCGFFDSV